MEIYLDDNFKITSDSMNYLLAKYSVSTNEDGEEIESRGYTTYHNTLKSLLRSYAQRKLRTAEGLNSIKEISEKEQEIFEEIESIKLKLEGEDI